MDQVSAAQVVPERDAQRPNLLPGDTAPCHTAARGTQLSTLQAPGRRARVTFIPTMPRRPAKGGGCAHSLWSCTFL